MYHSRSATILYYITSTAFQLFATWLSYQFVYYVWDNYIYVFFGIPSPPWYVIAGIYLIVQAMALQIDISEPNWDEDKSYPERLFSSIASFAGKYVLLFVMAWGIKTFFWS